MKSNVRKDNVLHPHLIGNHEKRMCGTKKRYTVEEGACEMIKQMQKWVLK